LTLAKVVAEGRPAHGFESVDEFWLSSHGRSGEPGLSRRRRRRRRGCGEELFQINTEFFVRRTVTVAVEVKLKIVENFECVLIPLVAVTLQTFLQDRFEPWINFGSQRGKFRNRESQNIAPRLISIGRAEDVSAE